MKTQCNKWQRTFANNIYDKEPVARINNYNDINNPNEQKIEKEISPKMVDMEN